MCGGRWPNFCPIKVRSRRQTLIPRLQWKTAGQGLRPRRGGTEPAARIAGRNEQ
jgi:hypothetical protein